MKRVPLSVQDKARKIKLLLLDVDGVLTDGGIYLDDRGVEIKRFDVRDGQGITLTFDAVLLHSVCRLLQAAVQKSDWDVELKLPGVEAPPEERPPRTLN